MPENTVKNPINPLKNLLLRFLRAFYDEKITYVDKILDQWLKGLVIWIINVFANGVLTYLVLLGIILIFPVTSINLGSEIWQRFLIVGLLGLIVWYFRETYKYLRINYRGGKK